MIATPFYTIVANSEGIKRTVASGRAEIRSNVEGLVECILWQ